jgi:hypothetical protein
VTASLPDPGYAENLQRRQSGYPWPPRRRGGFSAWPTWLISLAERRLGDPAAVIAGLPADSRPLPRGQLRPVAHPPPPVDGDALAARGSSSVAATAHDVGWGPSWLSCLICSRHHGDTVSRLLSTSWTNWGQVVHLASATSVGSGVGSASVSALNTGHISFSTTPLGMVARYRNRGNTMSIAAAGSANSWCSRRLTASGSDSPTSDSIRCDEQVVEAALSVCGEEGLFDSGCD